MSCNTCVSIIARRRIPLQCFVLMNVEFPVQWIISVVFTGATPIPWELFCWDFFEMYYKITGSSAKLDQCNTRFVGILLGQTPAIGSGGRYDCAACRDMKQTCLEVARARRIGDFCRSDTQTTDAVEGGPTPCWCRGESPM